MTDVWTLTTVQDEHGITTTVHPTEDSLCSVLIDALILDNVADESGTFAVEVQDYSLGSLIEWLEDKFPHRIAVTKHTLPTPSVTLLSDDNYTTEGEVDVHFTLAVGDRYCGCGTAIYPEMTLDGEPTGAWIHREAPEVWADDHIADPS